MEAFVLLGLFGGMAGVLAGFVGSGFWSAFSLVMERVGPTQEQVAGLVMGGGCAGAVLAIACLTIVIVVEG